MGTDNLKIMIGGFLPNGPVFGDKTINVDELHFDIPNLRSFLGSAIKVKKSRHSNRIKFHDQFFNIILDKILHYNNYLQNLRKAGGYLTLYSGSAKSRKGTISFQQAQDFARKLSHFLTLLNGNKITPVVIAGKFKRKKIWEYYPEAMSHEYRDVLSWTDFKQNGMETIWNSILKFHADPDRLDVLTSLLNWYVSANRNAVHVEGAVVMVQNALELLYNFIVIEEKGILSEDDSERLPAAAKIRLLLAH